MSGMHHHKGTSIMFQCGVRAWVCVGPGTLSAQLPPPPRAAADSLSQQPLNLLPACVIHTLTFLCWCLLSTWSPRPARFHPHVRLHQDQRRCWRLTHRSTAREETVDYFINCIIVCCHLTGEKRRRRKKKNDQHSLFAALSFWFPLLYAHLLSINNQQTI